jgi:dGTPase
MTRRLITRLIEDVIAESRSRIAASGVGDIEAVRDAGAALIAFSAPIAAADRSIKAFLFANMYRHPDVMRVRAEADSVVRALFGALHGDPAAMPAGWASGGSEAERARAAADYIAGMTDRFALAEHRRLFDAAPDLR